MQDRNYNEIYCEKQEKGIQSKSQSQTTGRDDDMYVRRKMRTQKCRKSKQMKERENNKQIKEFFASEELIKISKYTL